MTSDDMPPAPGPQPGAAPPPAGTPQPGRDNPRDGFFDSIRRMGLFRSDDRWVGGVAGGVADRFGVDPLVVRGLLILSFFLTGAGLVLYAVAWALLPERRDGRIHLQEAIRGTFDGALLGAVIAFVVGVAWNGGVGEWWGGAFAWLGVIFWIAVWVAVAVLVVQLFRTRRRPQAGPGGTPGEPAPPTPGYGPEATTSYTPSTPPYASPAAPFVPAPPASYVSTPAPAAPFSESTATRPSGAVPTSGYTPPTAPPSSRHHRPPQPPRPPRVRRGPGAGTVGIVMGLVLLAGAVLLVADRISNVDFPFWPTWLGAAIAIVGLGIVVSGLRGRTGGGLTGLALLGAFTALLVWVGPGQNDWDVWDGPRTDDGMRISEGTFVPRSIEDAENGAYVRFGSPTIDLTELDLSDVSPGDPVEVPVGLTAGAVSIIVPRDEAVEAQVRMLGGNVRWEVDDQSRSVAAVTRDINHFASDEVASEDGARLLILVDGGAGEITFEEGS